MLPDWLLVELELRERSRQLTKHELHRVEAISSQRSRWAVLARLLVRTGIWLNRGAALAAASGSRSVDQTAQAKPAD